MISTSKSVYATINSIYYDEEMLKKYTERVTPAGKWNTKMHIAALIREYSNLLDYNSELSWILTKQQEEGIRVRLAELKTRESHI